jgi:hypothetical protein
LKDFFGIGWGAISGVITFVSAFSYMKAIYTRELKRPVISTLALWLVIGVLLFFASIQSGARFQTTLFPVLMGVINPAIIIMLSLRYGEYTWQKLDTICALVCVITLLIWQTTESALFGIVGGLIADVFATAPMVIKSWKDPKDEPIFPWIAFAGASALNMLAIEEWVITYWLFPVYMTVMGITITFPLLLHRMKPVKV